MSFRLRAFSHFSSEARREARVNTADPRRFPVVSHIKAMAQQRGEVFISSTSQSTLTAVAAVACAMSQQQPADRLFLAAAAAIATSLKKE